MSVLAHAGVAHETTSPLLRWELSPVLAGVAVAALLYAVGLHRRASRSRPAGLDAACFAAGLAALGLAAASPIAAYDGELFWVHMLQHVIVLTVVPPLLLLGRPWSTIARALPVRFRRSAARESWAAPVRVAARPLASPPLGLAVFCAVLAVWHLPALYDATLRSDAAHELEHALFLAAGLLFWSQLVDSPPVRSRLDRPARAAYAAVAMLVGWVLALVLGLASAPLYAGYAELGSRPGGISALADQHLAAGIMWVPGSLAFTAALVVFVYRWLDESSGKPVPVRAGAKP